MTLTPKSMRLIEPRQGTNRVRIAPRIKLPFKVMGRKRKPMRRQEEIEFRMCAVGGVGGWGGLGRAFQEASRGEHYQTR